MEVFVRVDPRIRELIRELDSLKTRAMRRDYTAYSMALRLVKDWRFKEPPEEVLFVLRGYIKKLKEKGQDNESFKK